MDFILHCLFYIQIKCAHSSAKHFESTQSILNVLSVLSFQSQRNEACKIMRKQYNIYDYQLRKQVNECYGVITVALRDHRPFNEKVSFWGH